MGELEESIVASLRRFLTNDPECRNGMFVFPTSLMTRLPAFDTCVSQHGETDSEALMVCRPRSLE